MFSFFWKYYPQITQRGHTANKQCHAKTQRWQRRKVQADLFFSSWPPLRLCLKSLAEKTRFCPLVSQIILVCEISGNCGYLHDLAKGMRFGVEDHLVEIQGIRWTEEKVEILEAFREKEALH